MAGRYRLGGGELVTTDPDPLEIALKRAQLEELLQKPATERAQLALAQQDLALRGSTAASERQFKTFQGELAKQQAIEAGDIDRGKLEEERTRTRDTRAFQQGSLAEDTRYHTGQLAESKAGRESTAGTERERTRATLASNIMSDVLPGERAGQAPAGTTGAILARLGFPELREGEAEATQAGALQKARAALPEYQKFTPQQRETEMSTLPPEQRTALIGLLNQPKPGQVGPPMEETSAAPGPQAKPKLRMLDPNAPIFAPGENAITTALPGLRKFIAPPGSGLEALLGKPSPTPAPAPTPTPTATRRKRKLLPQYPV